MLIILGYHLVYHPLATIIGNWLQTPNGCRILQLATVLVKKSFINNLQQPSTETIAKQIKRPAKTKPYSVLLRQSYQNENQKILRKNLNRLNLNQTGPKESFWRVFSTKSLSRRFEAKAERQLIYSTESKMKFFDKTLIIITFHSLIN